MAEDRRLPVICGPTGAGKTKAALELAEQYPIEIVSADSRQIIRHLDIGTAKPTPEEQQRVRFHLLDLIEPGQRYSAFRFIEDADRAIDEIIKRENSPLIVGGTGLYLRALHEGVVAIEEDGTGEVRATLEQEMARLGPEKMHRRLAEVDSEEAERTHPNNKVRVIRALEIFELTGKSKSHLSASGAYKRSKYNYEFFCLAPPRAQLYAAINRRVDSMLSGGLFEELKRLVEAGMEEGIRKANIIGYKELMEVRDGCWSHEQAVSMIKQNSRRYAKRQMTWFRHQADCRFYPDRQSLVRSVKPV